jgi:alcohol dehydrogenase (cytochrome c)
MRSTQSGVYTDEQAAQGKDIYALQCLSCHPGDHTGDQFRKHWGGKLLSNLYGLMVETMPQDNAGSLPREDYVRVIAYLLKANGMPAGDTPLPDDSLALAKIRLDTVSTKR